MMRMILLLSCAMMLLAGCAEMPIKDGELTVGANTTATMDDVGVARIINRY